VIPGCPIRTSDNVKVADVAWISAERFQKIRDEIAYSVAPEVCVEVVSGSNSREEMDKKKALYFEVGAREVWFYGEDGALSFRGPDGVLAATVIASVFAHGLSARPGAAWYGRRMGGVEEAVALRERPTGEIRVPGRL